eukprot:scaffold312_cov256-Pinguiococcus_pyrenoidosus.AAC.9
MTLALVPLKSKVGSAFIHNDPNVDSTAPKSMSGSSGPDLRISSWYPMDPRSSDASSSFFCSNSTTSGGRPTPHRMALLEYTTCCWLSESGRSTSPTTLRILALLGSSPEAHTPKGVTTDLASPEISSPSSAISVSKNSGLRIKLRTTSSCVPPTPARKNLLDPRHRLALRGALLQIGQREVLELHAPEEGHRQPFWGSHGQPRDRGHDSRGLLLEGALHQDPAKLVDDLRKGVDDLVQRLRIREEEGIRKRFKPLVDKLLHDRERHGVVQANEAWQIPPPHCRPDDFDRVAQAPQLRRKLQAGEGASVVNDGLRILGGHVAAQVTHAQDGGEAGLLQRQRHQWLRGPFSDFVVLADAGKAVAAGVPLYAPAELGAVLDLARAHADALIADALPSVEADDVQPRAAAVVAHHVSAGSAVMLPLPDPPAKGLVAHEAVGGLLVKHPRSGLRFKCGVSSSRASAGTLVSPGRARARGCRRWFWPPPGCGLRQRRVTHSKTRRCSWCSACGATAWCAASLSPPSWAGSARRAPATGPSCPPCA